MSLSELCRDEFRYLFTSKRPAILLLAGVSLIYTVLFGFLYSGNTIKYIPLVIYDQDQTSTSRALANVFTDSEKVDFVGQVSSQEDLEQVLRENTALAAIVIPPHFQSDIKQGKGTDIAVMVNGTNVSFANVILNYTNEIVSTFSAGAGMKILEGANQLPATAKSSVAPIKLAIRMLHNPTTSYTNFILAGVALNGLQIALMLTVSPILFRFFSVCSQQRLPASPLVVLSKILPYWLCGTVIFLLILLILVLGFDNPARGSWLSMLLLGSAFCFALTAIFCFFSICSPHEAYTLQLPLLYIMPGLLYSGMSWPFCTMNTVGAFIASTMPLTYIGSSLRDLLLAGQAPFWLRDTCILYAGGIFFWLLAALLFTLRCRYRTRKEAAV